MPVIIRQEIPAYLIEETPVPAWNGKTTADLVEYTLDLKQALQQCNAKNVAIAKATKDTHE